MKWVDGKGKLIEDESKWRALPKKVKVRILDRHRQVADLYKKGYTQQAIADMLGVTRKLVCRDLKAITTLWREEGLDDIEEIYLRDLARLEELEFFCVRRLEKIKTPENGSRWVEMIMRIYDRRAKMLGYDAADKRVSQNVIVNIVNKEQRDAALQAVLKSQQLLENLTSALPQPAAECTPHKEPADGGVIDIDDFS
jgi:hypothetical protein